MKIIKIGTTSDPMFEIAWQIYEEAFPADERRARKKQAEVMKKKEYSFSAIVENNKCLGIIATWKLQGFQFIEHFAIKKNLRNKGRGSEVMKAFVTGASKAVLEVERPEVSNIAKRRIVFWERAGFLLNNFDYIQPSYGPGKSPVPMYLMTYPKKIQDKQFDSLRMAMHTQVYGHKKPIIKI